MKTNARGIQLTKQFEGLRLKAYRCPAGILTIGYGSTRNVREGMSISHEEAERRLLQDIREVETQVASLVKVPLSDNEFSALVSFVFNVGFSAFFRSTLLKLLNQNNRSAASEEFLKWVYANGQEVPGLLTRRKRELELFIFNDKLNHFG